MKTRYIVRYVAQIINEWCAMTDSREVVFDNEEEAEAFAKTKVRKEKSLLFQPKIYKEVEVTEWKLESYRTVIR